MAEARPHATVGGLSLTAEKVLKLLEEIRSLRHQLEQSIGHNAALSDQLHTRVHKHSPVSMVPGPSYMTACDPLHTLHDSK